MLFLPPSPPVLQLLRVKTMFSQPVTGPILLGLARTYVKAINNDVVPSIGDAWEEVSRGECHVRAAARRPPLPRLPGVHHWGCTLPLRDAAVADGGCGPLARFPCVCARRRL